MDAKFDEPATRGVQNPKVVDLIQLDSSSGDVVLVMVEQRGWVDWPSQLLEIQAKYNSYLSYTKGGWLTRDYPDYRNKRVRFELRCSDIPGEDQVKFLEAMRSRAESEAVVFGVTVRLREQDPGA